MPGNTQATLPNRGTEALLYKTQKPRVIPELPVLILVIFLFKLFVASSKGIR